MFEELLYKEIKLLCKEGRRIRPIKGKLVGFDNNFIAIEKNNPKKRVLVSKHFVIKIMEVLNEKVEGG